jgi:nitric oxide reductase activation protein
MIFKEWDFKTRSYSQEATVEVKKFNQQNWDGLKRFELQFGNLASILERSLESFQIKAKSMERRTKRFGTINQNYLIDEFTRANSGQELTQRIYDRRRNINRDISRKRMSLGVLLDQSGSTRFMVDNNNRRIDLIKYATLTIGKSLATIREKFFLCGYHSHSSSNPTVMEELKSEQEDWSNNIEQRIAAIEETSRTEYYNNKDGAAIRYANDRLLQMSDENKFLFLVTDGFPNCDHTYYQGNYAFTDTFKAMEEGFKKGIQYVYLTINPDDCSGFLRMINPLTSFSKQYKDMNKIVEGLTLIYEKMKKK